MYRRADVASPSREKLTGLACRASSEDQSDRDVVFRATDLADADLAACGPVGAGAAGDCQAVRRGHALLGEGKSPLDGGLSTRQGRGDEAFVSQSPGRCGPRDAGDRADAMALTQPSAVLEQLVGEDDLVAQAQALCAEVELCRVDRPGDEVDGRHTAVVRRAGGGR